MKDRYDKLAMITVVLLIIARVSSIMIDNVYVYLAPSCTAPFSMLIRTSSVAILPFLFAVHVAIGIWLFCEAKKDGSRPWIWMLFGLFFELTAVVVFYIIRIYEKLRIKNSEESTSISKEHEGGKSVGETEGVRS